MNRPYTRTSKRKGKAYIKVVPHNKVVKYNLGNSEAYHQGKFKYGLRFISQENANIRDNALEAGRMVINKVLEKNAPKQFYFEVRVFPHHILRNNKTAAGAGADRLSSGMKHSFGIIEGRAAQVYPGRDIFFVACENEQTVRTARKALTMVKAKIPCRSKILQEKIE